MKIPQFILRYWLAMNATAFDSAVHSLVIFCGLAGAHQLVTSVTALDAQQLAGVFLIAFGRSLLSYLDAHPLAQLLPPPKLQTPPNPPAPN